MAWAILSGPRRRHIAKPRRSPTNGMATPLRPTIASVASRWPTSTETSAHNIVRSARVKRGPAWRAASRWIALTTAADTNKASLRISTAFEGTSHLRISSAMKGKLKSTHTGASFRGRIRAARCSCAITLGTPLKVRGVLLMDICRSYNAYGCAHVYRAGVNSGGVDSALRLISRARNIAAES